MCGITGFVNLSLEPARTAHLLDVATQRLRHRGPDQFNTYSDSLAGLGVSRLAIRDVARGCQPMRAEDGTVIAFNGELYGAEALRETLRQEGHRFHSTSDTEILLRAYLTWGDAVFASISGMFAVAIWEPRRRRLALARDRWGEKPLYIATTSGGIVFASEPKALRVWPGVDWNLTIEDFAAFLRYGYMPGATTGWRGVTKLPPGHVGSWEDGAWSQRPYVSPPLPGSLPSVVSDLDAAAEELRVLLQGAVRSCMVSDRPVGAFLSGGIDSSSVVALMSELAAPVHTYSINWEAEDYSEATYARIVVSHVGAMHHEVLCSSGYLQEHFDSIVATYDEPFGDESMIPTTLLSEIAKCDVDVVLSGDGADELFGGYQRYENEQSLANYLDTCASTSLVTLQKLVSPSLSEAATPDATHQMYYAQARECDVVSARRWLDLHTYLPSQILTKVDRASMRVALEVRAPFLTPQISSWALRCDPRLIFTASQTKRVLRAAMAPYLPGTILTRPKMGFGVPLVHWFRGPLRQWVGERLFEGALPQFPWLQQRSVQRLLSEHQQHEQNHYRVLYNLLVLESWVRQTPSTVS